MTSCRIARAADSAACSKVAGNVGGLLDGAVIVAAAAAAANDASDELWSRLLLLLLLLKVGEAIMEAFNLLICSWSDGDIDDAGDDDIDDFREVEDVLSLSE